MNVPTADILCDIAMVSNMAANWQLENLSDFLVEHAAHDPDELIAVFVQFAERNGVPPELVSDFGNCIRESTTSADRNLCEHRIRNLLRKIAAQLTARREFAGPDDETRVSRIVAGVIELENLWKQFSSTK